MGIFEIMGNEKCIRRKELFLSCIVIRISIINSSKGIVYMVFFFVLECCFK